jgi:pyridoxamine 5'-phosphate oxidase family protein
MSTFSDDAVAYLESQRLGRLATVGRDGAPQVVPVGFRLNRELGTIDVGGRAMGGTKKFADVAREHRAAIVVDDVLPPWRPRGVEVRGRAEALATGGEAWGRGWSPELIRIWPDRVRAWGLDEKA